MSATASIVPQPAPTLADSVAWATDRADIHHERCRAARTGDYCVACIEHEKAIRDATAMERTDGR